MNELGFNDDYEPKTVRVSNRHDEEDTDVYLDSIRGKRVIRYSIIAVVIGLSILAYFLIN